MAGVTKLIHNRRDIVELSRRIPKISERGTGVERDAFGKSRLNRNEGINVDLAIRRDNLRSELGA